MIFFKENRNIIYIKAEGHITAQICSGLKKRVFDKLEAEPSIAHIYVDMSECAYMDSTFLGLLAGFTNKLRNSSGNRLEVQNAGHECEELLNSMGLDRILSINKTAVPFPEQMENIKGSDITPETLLAAHENLMELSEENRKRFSSLHTLLNQQLKDTKKEPPEGGQTS